MKRYFIVILILSLHGNTLAQSNPLTSPTNQFGTSESYFEAGSNYTYFQKTNFYQGNQFISQLNQISWFGFDDDEEQDEEPIDEIIVIGRRTGFGAILELTSHFQYGDMWTKRCSYYSDGGRCLAYENVFNRDNWPLEGECQSISGTMGPLTSSEATNLNLEYQQGRAVAAGSAGTVATLAASALTSGSSLILQLFASGAVGVGTMMATYPDAGDFPFAVDDTVTYSLNACNDGEGGINVDLDVTIQ